MPQLEFKSNPNTARTPLEVLTQSCRRRVMAGMETGNPSAARIAVKELEEVDEEAAKSLRLDVVAAYGVHL